MFRYYLLLLLVVLVTNGCTATEVPVTTEALSAEATVLLDTSVPGSTPPTSTPTATPAITTPPTLDVNIPPDTPDKNSTNIPINTQPYFSKNLGFSLMYPVDWEVNEDEYLVTFSSSTDELDPKNVTDAALWIGTTQIDTTMADMLEEFPSEVVVLHEGSLSFGFETWVSTQISFDNENLKGRAVATLCLIVKDDQGYMLVAVAPAEEWNTRQPLFQKMIDTFKFEEVDVVDESSTEVSVDPEPTATAPEPTATTTPVPLSEASPSFRDVFNKPELNSQRWVPIPGAGQIELDNDAVQLSSSGETFPVVYARENPFPVSGNFTVNVSMRYLSVTERGVGFRLGSTSADYGTHQNLERAELDEKRIIEIWQDATNWHISVGENDTEVHILLAPDLNQHRIAINYIDGVYQVLLDDIEVYVSNPTADRPTVLWFGNPAQEDSAGVWSSLEISAISVGPLAEEQVVLRPTPTPSLPVLDTVSADGTCVAVNDAITITSEVFHQSGFGEAITKYLNDGGSVDALATSLASTGSASEPILLQVVSQDVTASGIPDILMAVTMPYDGGSGETHVLFFTCEAGRYKEQILFRRAGAGSRGEGLYAGGGAVVKSLRDLNGNGMPDVVIKVNWPNYAEYYLLEWDGEQFSSLIEYVDVLGDIIYYRLEVYQGGVYFNDLDGDGVFEMIVTRLNTQTQKKETVTWQWAREANLYLPVAPDHPVWTTYTNANDVYDMTFDHEGYLWAATSGGEIRWNLADSTYTKYTIDNGLGNNIVQAVAVSPDGTLWFGTQGGVSSFDGQSWTTYTEADGLADNWVNAIAVASDGTLWFGTQGGVSSFDGEIWATYTTADGLENNRVTAIAIANDGALWFGSSGGASRFDGQSWSMYTRDLGGYWVDAIAVAPDGALWFGTQGGVFRFDGQSWTTYTEADGLADNWIRAIAVAPDGGLWVGTESGVSYFNGQTWTDYADPGSAVKAIAVGPDGTPWFGTVKGILHLDGDLWTAYIDQHLSSVADIACTSDGTVWFGTKGGVFRFDGETWTIYTTADGLADNWVNAIAVAPDGVLWVGTKLGVSRFDGETWSTYTTADGLAGDWVNAIAVTPDGTLWFGTNGGLSRFDGQSWSTYTKADGLADNWVNAIAVAPDGALWAGGDGIAHFDGESWTQYESNWGTTSWISAIAVAPDGTVWVGTHDSEYSRSRGVFRFDGETWINYTADDGLAGNIIPSIAVAPDGTVWVGAYSELAPDGASSVSYFDGETWHMMTDGPPADRYISDIAVAPDGALWFDADGMVLRYLPSE
jgi:ligand-binding sensor domain-containing protein